MGKQITEVFKKITTRIKSIAFHPSNPTFITAHHCGSINIWNYHYQQVICELKEHVGSVRIIKMHPNGEVFATAGNDKVICVWNYKTRTLITKMKGHTDYIRSLDFHPTRPWIISGSDDCLIKIWDYMSGQLVCTSSGHTHYVMSVIFADSSHIISGSLDHNICLWNCSNLFEKKTFLVPDVILMQTIEAHEKGINSLCLKDDVLLSASDDKEVKIWKYRNNDLYLEKTLFSHESNVTSVYSDGTTYYSGSEDNCLCIFYKGKTSKINVNSRVWAIGGKDDCIAIGTDDGLIVYTTQMPMSYAMTEHNIFYAIDNNIFQYNFKKASEYAKIKGSIESLFCKEEKLIVQTNVSYSVYDYGNKIEEDAGYVIYHKEDKYVFNNNNLYKNGDLYRPYVLSKYESGQVILKNGENGIFIIDQKTIVYIVDDEELSSTFNFVIRDVITRDEQIVVFGDNKILFLDQHLKMVDFISELVQITGGIFYDEILIYSTLTQVKYFYEDKGVLQSVDCQSRPICVKDEFLYLLTNKGIQKCILNLSEIRFRRAVLNDGDILSVIKTEQLPGLSPLEYLIKKGKGGIALPYIKDEEKKFELFLSENSLKKAFELCKNSKMYEKLGFKALSVDNYEIAESCFKKNKDFKNLFFLYLSTKQFEKLKELEGDELENMAKIILEDTSIVNGNKQFNTVENSKLNTAKNSKLNESTDQIVESSKPKLVNNVNNQKVNNKTENAIHVADTKHAKQNDDLEDKNKESENICTGLNEMSINNSDSKNNINTPYDYYKEDDTISNTSIVRTDNATLNDSDFQNQICNFDRGQFKPDDKEIETIYSEALDLTTKGKFNKASECFRWCLSNIAYHISEIDDYLDLRRSIGNYLFGLHIERNRRGIEDPSRNMQLAVFFSNIPLEKEHQMLASNLAMMACYKNGNYKTAKTIAAINPEGKNSQKIIDQESNEDKYELKYILNQGNTYYDEEGKFIGELCYDTLEIEIESKCCALCFVHSKSGEKCPSCEIGILN